MSLEVLAAIDERFTSALAFHMESQILFMYVGLEGYAALHRHQYIEESATKMQVKEYAIVHYGYPLIERSYIEPRIINRLINGKARDKISANDLWLAVWGAWDLYVQWESDTLKEYGQYAHALLDDVSMGDYEFIMRIVRDVSTELTNIKKMADSLQSMEYDMPTIVSMQADIKEKYT